MVRLAVLQAAPTLAAVPTRPPLRLRRRGAEFLVDLTQQEVLRFKPLGPSADADPTTVRQVLILGL